MKEVVIVLITLLLFYVLWANREFDFVLFIVFLFYGMSRALTRSEYTGELNMPRLRKLLCWQVETIYCADTTTTAASLIVVAGSDNLLRLIGCNRHCSRMLWAMPYAPDWLLVIPVVREIFLCLGAIHPRAVIGKSQPVAMTREQFFHYFDSLKNIDVYVAAVYENGGLLVVNNSPPGVHLNNISLDEVRKRLNEDLLATRSETLDVDAVCLI